MVRQGGGRGLSGEVGMGPGSAEVARREQEGELSAQQNHLVAAAVQDQAVAVPLQQRTREVSRERQVARAAPATAVSVPGNRAEEQNTVAQDRARVVLPALDHPDNIAPARLPRQERQEPLEIEELLREGALSSALQRDRGQRRQPTRLARSAQEATGAALDLPLGPEPKTEVFPRGTPAAISLQATSDQIAGEHQLDTAQPIHATLRRLVVLLVFLDGLQESGQLRRQNAHA